MSELMGSRDRAQSLYEQLMDGASDGDVIDTEAMAWVGAAILRGLFDTLGSEETAIQALRERAAHIRPQKEE